MSRTLFSLAGFQVIISGRFWVIAEAEGAVLVGLSRQEQWQRLLHGGLQRALYHGVGKTALLDGQQRQRIVALACSPLPEGRAR
jgi:hypothetical protein